MAKKFTRGITNIKNILHQGFDTNNVNDLLSDGEHNYIHRKKKDKSQEYHCLTDNIKTIKSDNTDLLKVTNYNKSNNTATLHPQHDKLKEQVIESTANTIDIDYGENGTEETTKVDVNPQKVLLHDNLTNTDNGVVITHTEGEDTTTIDLSDTFKTNNATKLSIVNTSGYGYIGLNSRANKFGKDYTIDQTGLTNKINEMASDITELQNTPAGGGTVTYVLAPLDWKMFQIRLVNNVPTDFFIKWQGKTALPEEMYDVMSQQNLETVKSILRSATGNSALDYTPLFDYTVGYCGLVASGNDYKLTNRPNHDITIHVPIQVN